MPAAAKWLAVLVATAAFASFAQAQNSPNRKEMKRADLTGTKMEVILSTAEYKPGEVDPAPYPSRRRSFLRARRRDRRGAGRQADRAQDRRGLDQSARRAACGASRWSATSR